MTFKKPLFEIPTVPALWATLTAAMLLACSTPTVQAATIFTDPFSSTNSNWANNAQSPATFGTIGGLTGDTDGYITAAAVTTTSGAVVLRGQTNLSSSPGLFGNWTSTGTSPLAVVTFSLDLFQDSSTTQSFGLRFTNASGFPGAFSIATISVLPEVWTHFDIPVTEGSFTFPEGGGDYNTVFSALSRVQLTVVGTPTTAFNVRMDNPTISNAPEPTSIVLLGAMGVYGLTMRRRRG